MELKNYITEAFKINKNTKLEKQHKYFPKTKDELLDIIEKRIKAEGNNCDLNDIDVSKITNMSELFYKMKEFNGDISKWDVSNVTHMSGMFFRSNFNGDISEWDVSKVEYMNFMFSESDFRGDISNWNVSDECEVYGMINKNFYVKNPNLAPSGVLERMNLI